MSINVKFSNCDHRDRNLPTAVAPQDDFLLSDVV